MSIVIEPYLERHEEAVEGFNQRLHGAGQKLKLFRRDDRSYLLKSEGSNLYQELFVALEDGVVRGGYILKHQPFSFPDSSIRSVGYYHHCLSEGIINHAYARVGSLLLMHAMRRVPLLFCLGMDGYGRPLPNMLVRLGWAHYLVPFYLRVLRPYRFLRGMQGLRTSALRRLAMDVAAYSGAGWVSMKVLRTVQAVRSPAVASFAVEEFADFSDWVNPLWEHSKSSYGLVATRDSQSLRTLYPSSFSHLKKLRVVRDGRVLGWAVIGERRKNPRWGDLRVGTIIDCWASPDDALTVIQAATAVLEQWGLDVIVSNQSHRAWCDALEKSGFLKTRSNFLFAASKNLAGLLQPFEQAKSAIHVTRADGDGLPWAY